MNTQIHCFKAYYFGAHRPPGVIDVMVDCHNINKGINQPDLSPIFRRKDILAVLISLPFNTSPHLHFISYIAGARKHKGADSDDDGEGYEIVVFRRNQGSDRLGSIEDEDLEDNVTLSGIISE